MAFGEMRTDEVPLTLTDDELVALAVGVGVAWPSALPSLGDELDVLDAPAWRGLRSLKVRELAGPGRDGTVVNADLLALLEPAFTGGLRVVVAWVTEDGLYALGFSASYYETDGQGLMECTSSEGIHGFSACDQATFAEVATNLAFLAHRGELHRAIGGEPGLGAISIAVPLLDGGVRSALVSKGLARETSVVDGALSIGAEGELDQIVARVLAP